MLPELSIPEDVHLRSLIYTDEGTQDRMQILTDQEINRRAGMRNEQRRRSFTAGRIALRTMLAEQLDINPVDVPIIVEPSGRLACPGSGLHLSLAHSGDVAVAVASPRLVGVDLEQVRPKPDALLEYILADEEREHVRSLNVPPNQKLFLCWTVKEAVLKANGTGLRKSPRLVRLSLDVAHQRGSVRDPDNTDWSVTFGLSDDLALSLAVLPA
ncbi:MAG: 4'-phosphopantetheinyl transferase superfamily protein [Bacteroidota bacterium]|nr:4'-phosphopantetheinyl transferase superfamily protein [Bacteroidota bacterium]